jgi:transposase-like protein
MTENSGGLFAANIVCPRCESDRRYFLRSRNKFRCIECKREYSATSGTIIHSRKMPLEKYDIAFEAFRTGASTTDVARLIGCNYKAAWRLRHVAIRAITNRNGNQTVKA